MSKIYKKKWIANEYYSDNRDKPSKHSKYFNSSERERGKLEAVSQLKEYEMAIDPETLSRLRSDYEHDMAWECSQEEFKGLTSELSRLLSKLGIGRFKIYKCTCPKTEDITDEEILRNAGLL